jgi:hypothetical protein
MRMTWTPENEALLISLRLDGKKWKYIANVFNSTEFAVSRKYCYLRASGLAPYKKHDYWNKIDEIKSYLLKYGHVKTVEKYGSYVIHFLKRNNLWKRTQPKPSNYIDKFLKSKDKFYWAGFIAADGCVKGKKHVEIGLAIKDKNHLLKIHALAGGSFYVTDKVCTWSIHRSGDLVRFLNDLNITRRKTFTLKPPVGLSESDTKDFIRGYFDGDGCVTCSWQSRGWFTKMFIFLGTEKMLKWIRLSLRNYAKCTNYPKLTKNRSIHSISYGSKKDFMCIGKWLYSSNGVCLKRKRKKYYQILSIMTDVEEKGKYNATDEARI